jgi:hypothetical protein
LYQIKAVSACPKLSMLALREFLRAIETLTQWTDGPADTFCPRHAGLEETYISCGMNSGQSIPLIAHLERLF